MRSGIVTQSERSSEVQRPTGMWWCLPSSRSSRYMIGPDIRCLPTATAELEALLAQALPHKQQLSAELMPMQASQTSLRRPTSSATGLVPRLAILLR